MATSTLTSKGQITVPKAIRDHLSLEAGDRVDFMINEDGTVEVRALERPIDELYGFLRQPGVAAGSLEQIDEAVAEGRAVDDERIRDESMREDEG